jgi:hypothetical protein
MADGVERHGRGDVGRVPRGADLPLSAAISAGGNDTIIAYATMDGMPAFRDVNSGSWFINALNDVS